LFQTTDNICQFSMGVKPDVVHFLLIDYVPPCTIGDHQKLKLDRNFQLSCQLPTSKGLWG